MIGRCGREMTMSWRLVAGEEGTRGQWARIPAHVRVPLLVLEDPPDERDFLRRLLPPLLRADSPLERGLLPSHDSILLARRARPCIVDAGDGRGLLPTGSRSGDARSPGSRRAPSGSRSAPSLRPAPATFLSSGLALLHRAQLARSERSPLLSCGVSAGHRRGNRGSRRSFDRLLPEADLTFGFRQGARPARGLGASFGRTSHDAR